MTAAGALVHTVECDTIGVPNGFTFGTLTFFRVSEAEYSRQKIIDTVTEDRHLAQAQLCQLKDGRDLEANMERKNTSSSTPLHPLPDSSSAKSVPHARVHGSVIRGKIQVLYLLALLVLTIVSILCCHNQIELVIHIDGRPEQPALTTHSALRSMKRMAPDASLIRSSSVAMSVALTKLSVYEKPVGLPQSLAMPIRIPAAVGVVSRRAAIRFAAPSATVTDGGSLLLRRVFDAIVLDGPVLSAVRVAGSTCSALKCHASRACFISCRDTAGGATVARMAQRAPTTPGR
eukprot:CAMPEP_0115853678 /NCGR_PEP_ID=MMETSP0287-20121206/13629_1 /TAXON_ID=412157 /ORGANISM="Chrysochromulina rotalis, Strain UIO044" /LENGTH=288 /DNA_ID=CAMNT_0003307765 /DNA_START=129 /DNA_END=998 /DNA_ORIENTATION=+